MTQEGFPGLNLRASPGGASFESNASWRIEPRAYLWSTGLNAVLAVLTFYFEEHLLLYDMAAEIAGCRMHRFGW